MIVGSDEVWKLEHGVFSKPFPNVYWINPSLKCKKIAMAASANRLVYNNLDNKLKERMAEMLSSFDLLGVRDNHTINFLLNIGINKPIYKVPDPTIAFTVPQVDIKSKLAQTGINLNRPIAGINVAQRTAKTIDVDLSGYQVVAYGRPYKNAHFDLSGTLNPFEWASFHKYLNLCVTDSYHSTIFSLKNNVPVVVRDTDRRYKNTKSKIRDLLDDIDMLCCYGSVDEVIKRYNPDLAQKGLKHLKWLYGNFMGVVKNALNS